jgi:hypothetical protein
LGLPLGPSSDLRSLSPFPTPVRTGSGSEGLISGRFRPPLGFRQSESPPLRAVRQSAGRHSCPHAFVLAPLAKPVLRGRRRSQRRHGSALRAGQEAAERRNRAVHAAEGRQARGDERGVEPCSALASR